MSFTGRMAYRTLMLMSNMFPSMKADFTDMDKKLKESKKINDKIVWGSDRNGCMVSDLSSDHRGEYNRYDISSV